MADKTFNVESLKGTITFPASDTVSTGTQVIGAVNGVTKTIILTTPANMQIVNSSDAAFFTSGTKAQSTTSVIGSEVAIVQGDKIVMTAEGTQSTANAVVFDIRYTT
jgi:hypothetical protein